MKRVELPLSMVPPEFYGLIEVFEWRDEFMRKFGTAPPLLQSANLLHLVEALQHPERCKMKPRCAEAVLQALTIDPDAFFNLAVYVRNKWESLTKIQQFLRNLSPEIEVGSRKFYSAGLTAKELAWHYASSAEGAYVEKNQAELQKLANSITKARSKLARQAENIGMHTKDLEEFHKPIPK
jgi:hypothetical protein